MSVMPQITNFTEAHDWLSRFAPANVRRPAYILDNMQRVMDFLGNPQDRLRVIHVAGTSGKTSTCYYIASLLGETGNKVGLSVSPYIHQMNERVQINMAPLDEQAFCRDLSQFLQIIEGSGAELTYFEILTAFMYWEFDRLKVDWAVVEVGLGGELDATNIVGRQDKVCVITDIGLDHQSVLGDTTTEISRHKAGIIQHRNKVIVRDQEPQILSVIRERARKRQADLLVVGDGELPGAFDFMPLFQKRNFGLATVVYDNLAERNLAPKLDTGKLPNASRVAIPARMETFAVGGKTVILDGAHNPQKFRALCDSVRQRYSDEQVAALVAFKANQEHRIEPSTGELVKLARHITVTSYGKPNGVDPYGEDPNLVVAMCKVHGFADVESISEPAHAWKAALARPEPILLVTGSFYLFNEIYPLIKTAAI